MGKMSKIGHSDDSLIFSIIKWWEGSIVLIDHWLFLLSIKRLIFITRLRAHQYVVDLRNIMAKNRLL
jgi:hypothetical protein